MDLATSGTNCFMPSLNEMMLTHGGPQKCRGSIFLARWQLGFKDLLVTRACQACLDHKDLQGGWEFLVHRDPQVDKVHKELQVLLAPQESQALKVLQELLGRQAWRLCLEQR